MKNSAILPMFLFFVTFTSWVLAADWKPLQGTYALTAMNYLDPADDEPKDNHLRFQLSGDAAKDVYLAMKVAEKPDECTGATSKQVGEMQCLYDKNEDNYTCHFSINLMEQRIEYGIAC